MAEKKSSSKKAENPKPQEPTGPSELDQLRDIVFGQAKSKLESQLDTLQKQMHQDFAKAEENLNRQMQQMQALLEDQVHKLEDKLALAEQHSDEKANELNGYADKIASELEMAEANAKQENDELHDRLDKELAKLSDKFTQQHKEAMAKLNQVAAELSSSKTDRKTLAKLLATVATNLETDGTD